MSGVAKPKGWKPASSTERGRASILEQRARISPEEAKWLAEFRRSHPKRASSRSSSTPSTSTPASGVVDVAPPAPPPEPEKPPELEEEVELELDDEDDVVDVREDVRRENAPASPPALMECDIPDCSACRTMRGAMICKVTGRATYPRLSEEGAEMFASIGAGAVHLFARTTRRDGYAPRPTPAEKARLTKGVKMVADRRFPQAGAVDDVLVLLHGFYHYGSRALSEANPNAQQRPALRVNDPTPAPAPEASTSTSSPATSPAPQQQPAPPARTAPAPTEADNDADDDFDDAAIERELKRGQQAQVH